MNFDKVLTEHLMGQMSTEDIIDNNPQDVVNYNNFILNLLNPFVDAQYGSTPSSLDEIAENVNQREYLNLHSILNVEFIKYAYENVSTELDNIHRDSVDIDAAAFIYTIENFPTCFKAKRFLNKEELMAYLKIFCEYYNLEIVVDNDVIEYLDRELKEIAQAIFINKDKT